MDKKQNNSKAKSKQVSVKGNRDVVCLGISMVLSILFLNFFLSPLYQKQLALEKAYAAKQDDLKSKKALLGDIETFNRKNQDLSVNSKKLVLLIPNRNNYEDFFIHLQQLSKNYNLELLSFKLEDAASSTASNAPGTTTSTGAVITPEGGAAATTTPAEAELNQQGITLSLRGDFINLLGFTKALENGIPFLQEDSLDISASKDTGGQAPQGGGTSSLNPTLDTDLKLRFIYY